MISTKVSCAGPYLVLRCLVWCVWGHEVVWSWRGWLWCSFRVIWVVWGVFTDKHVDANCRTVNLMFFQVAVLRTGKLPYSKRFLFLIIYVKSRLIQIKLIPNVISNKLIILALKMRCKTVLNNAETNIFQWDMLFLAVPAGSVSRYFVTYSKNWSFWRARTSVWLLQRWILFTSKAGAHYKPLKKTRLTHPLHAMSVLTLDSPGTKFRSRCYTLSV